MTEVPSGTEANRDTFFVYWPSLRERIASSAGWVLGWIADGVARIGWFRWSDMLADDAIKLRRHNMGAIRALGRKAGREGRRASFRGRLLVSGRIGEHGPFAGRGFFATYDVAAPDKARALMLVRRFERDVVPSSLQIEEGELNIEDSGAEGVIWVAPGRTFYGGAD